MWDLLDRTGPLGRTSARERECLHFPRRREGCVCETQDAPQLQAKEMKSGFSDVFTTRGTLEELDNHNHRVKNLL